MPADKPRSARGKTSLTLLVVTLIINLLGRRFKSLRRIRQLLPIALSVLAWWYNRSPKSRTISSGSVQDSGVGVDVSDRT